MGEADRALALRGPTLPIVRQSHVENIPVDGFQLPNQDRSGMTISPRIGCHVADYQRIAWSRDSKLAAGVFEPAP